MKKFNLREMEKCLKSCLKNRVNVTSKALILFLMTGFFSIDLIANKPEKKVNIVVNEKEKNVGLNSENISTIGKEGIQIGDKSVIFSEGSRAAVKGRKIDLQNQDPERRFIETAYGYEGYVTITNGDKYEERFKNTIESVVIGHRSAAYTPDVGKKIGNVVAVGHMAVAGPSAVALGDNTAAIGQGSIAIGKDTYLGKGKSIAIGYKSYSMSDATIGIGAFNVIKGNYAVGIGYNTILESEKSVAIGQNARVNADKSNSVAIGSDSLTTANLNDSGYDLEKNTNSTETGAIWKPNYGEFAVGNGSTKTRRITGVAAGSSDTDAVNVAQLKKAINSSVETSGSTALTIKDKKVNLDEPTLITNLSNGANLSNPVNNNYKLVTDKQVYDYIEAKTIIVASDKEIKTANKYALKLNNTENRLNLLAGEGLSVKPKYENSTAGFEFSLTEKGVEDKHIKENAITTKKIKDKNVTEEKLSESLKTKINNKLDNDAISVAKKDGSSSALSVDTDPNGSKHYKIGLDETTLINNLSSNANIHSPAVNNKKLITDEYLKKYFANEEIPGLNKNSLNAYDYNHIVFTNNTDDKISDRFTVFFGGRINFLSGDGISVVTDTSNGKSSFKFNLNTNGVLTKHIANKNVTEEKLSDVLINKINKINEGITFLGDNSTKTEVIKLGDKLTLKDENKNINIKGNGKNIELGLNSTLKGIQNIGNDDKNTISFGTGEDDKTNLKIKIGGADLTLTKVSKDNEKEKIKISNVATPNDDYDAVNKKYVDDKIDDSNKKIDYLNQNIPVIYTDKDGKEIVRNKDGKFYEIGKDGNITDKEYKGDVFVSLKDKDKSSGLGFKNIDTIDEFKAKNKIKELVETKNTSTNLNNLATIRDLQVLGLAGLNFTGNDKKDILHKNLGQTLTIKGSGTEEEFKNFTASTGNINVKVNSDALEIELSKRLKDLESAVFDKLNDDGTKFTTTIDGDGTLVFDNKGKTAKYGLDKISLRENNKERVSVDKDKLKFIKEDGTDGLEINAKESKITGLETPTKEKDAANKKYVDDKFKESNEKIDSVNKNIPVVYTDEKGNEVIRKNDGNFYKITRKDDGTNLEEKIEAKDVYVSLKDKNNSSGLGLNNLEKLEYTKVQELIKTLNESEKDKPYLNNIATIRDLQALGLAGLNFTGNDKDNILHKNLGETLTIKGSGTLVDENNKFEGADGNINVKVNSDALEIELSKRLKDLETAVFEKEVLDKDGKMKKVTNTIDTNGSVINGVDGKSAKYTLEGSSIKDNDKEILTKADGITIKDKIDGKDVDVISIKNASGKGKIEFSKDKDGKGTGTISGLADPTQDDHATNKHYVDSKIKELIDNSPIKYIDENGNRKEKGKHFIVGQDGKMYDPNLIKDKIYDKDKGGYVSKDDEDAEPIKAIENISAILDPKTKLGGLESTIENANEYINKENLDENEKKNAINSNDLHSVSKAIIEKGLSFGADKGKVTKKSLGETLNIKGGTNINTEVKDGNIIVNLNEEIKLTNTTLNKDGLNIKDDKGNLYINSNSIKGLADLNENSSGDLAANKNYVDSKAKEIKASSNGAIAGAIAMANLPQVSGNSIANVSAALGYQDKSVALALGVSGTNKKGNVVYKASGSINTQANVSLGAGLGYQFGVNRSKEIVDINSIKKVVNKHTVKIKQLEDKNKVLEKEVNLNKENYKKLNERNDKLEKELNELKELLKKITKKVEKID